jgi:hypothetical protein
VFDTTPHDAADMRVQAPAHSLRERQRAEETAPYIDLGDMRHEMWRRRGFTIFSTI